MKNSHWTLFFAVLLILLLPFQTQAQEAIQAATPGLFQRIGSWIQTNLVGMSVVFVFGLLAKGGWTLMIKKIAHKGTVIMKEVGEFCTDSSEFLATLDTSIKEDGTIKQNSVSELIQAGRHVIAEGKDVIISIRPKL